MKKISHKLSLLASLASVIAIPMSTMACGKSTISAKAVFWNYEDYISEEAEDGITKDGFTFQQFGDLPTFETNLRQGNAAGGIGSDWLNATLAKAKIIKKINFNKVFEYTQTGTELENKLKTLYTPEAWKLMAQFDSYIGDVDGDGTPDKLYEYTIPYFMQNKVIAVNPYKVAETSQNKSFLDTLKSGSQEDVQQLFATKTWSGILSTLKGQGFTQLAVNDYMRDNLMIGSEGNTADNFTSQIDKIATAESHLDGFKNLIDTFGKSNVVFETSGVKNIEKILSKNSGSGQTKQQIAFAYNGDALFAHNGLYDDSYKSNEIRIINPTNSSFLMDGFVVSAYASTALEDKLYGTVKKYLYGGFDKLFTDAEFEDENILFDNFDYVNYTPAFEQLHKYVETNYFDDDEVGKDIIMSTRNAAGTNSSKITDKNVTSIITSRSIITSVTTKYNTYKSS